MIYTLVPRYTREQWLSNWRWHTEQARDFWELSWSLRATDRRVAIRAQAQAAHHYAVARWCREILASGVNDVHIARAMSDNDCSADEVTPEMRRDAKARNYLAMYAY